jgi:hypothetical protein
MPSGIVTKPDVTSQPPNFGVGDTYSWIKVNGLEDYRQMFARAVYVTNLSELSLSLSASDVNIGGVEIVDHDSGLRCDVTSFSYEDGSYNALRVVTQDLDPSFDGVHLGDTEGNVVGVNPDTSSLLTEITNFNTLSSLLKFDNIITLLNVLTANDPTLDLNTDAIEDQLNTVNSLLNALTAREYEININADHININTDEIEGQFDTANSLLNTLTSYNVYGTTNTLPLHITGNLVNQQFSYTDNSGLDAFGRLRVSEPYTLLDAKHLYDKLPFIFDEKVNGTATSSFSSNDSMVVMSTTNPGDYVIRQTKSRFNYQPGKSLQAFFTGFFKPEDGVIKRVGLFYGASAAPYDPVDGIYLEVIKDGPRFCIVKEQGYKNTITIPQSAWNVDRLDGTGPSKVNVSLSAAQIFVIDYEWLGLGRVRLGFAQAGKIHYAHYFNHVNELDRPYITSPNQPVRYEIRQTKNQPGNLHHICSTVMVEGGEENIGKPISLMGESVTNINTANYKALIAVRLKDIAYNSSVTLKSVDVLNYGQNQGYYSVLLNPTIISGTLTWADVPGTAIQYSTSNVVVSEGYSLFKSLIPAGLGGASISQNIAVLSELTRLGVNINWSKDFVVIAGRSLNQLTDMIATMHLLERS